MRGRDLLLVSVTLGGMGLGVMLPAPAQELKGLTPYLLMGLLFLSFLRLDLAALLRPGPGVLAEVAFWSLIKLVALPLLTWGLAKWLLPQWALAVLLLSAVSTGVTCPFYASLLGADMPRALLTVVATSLLLPLSLPALIRLLEGAETAVPYLEMFRLLAMLIFAPAALMALARRFCPVFVAWLERTGFFLSLALLFAISAVVFAPFGEHFSRDAASFAEALLLSFLLCGLYLALGWGAPRLAPGRLDPLTGATSLVYINNVLGVVFASRFLDFQSVLLCGCYLFPIYLALLPLRMLARHLPGGPGPGTASG